MEETPQSLDAPGVITVVTAPEENAPKVKRPRARKAKRPRETVAPSPDPAEDDELESPENHMDSPHPANVRTITLDEENGTVEDGGDDMSVTEVEEPEPRNKVQRFIDALHRRRKGTRHMSDAMIQEDFEQVKNFLSCSEEEQDAYLAIYEYDHNRDVIKSGIGKVATMSLRFALLRAVAPQHYSLVDDALKTPEVMDTVDSIYDVANLGELNPKVMRVVANVGHIGDTLLQTSMNLYAALSKLAEEHQNRQKAIAAYRNPGATEATRHFDQSSRYGQDAKSPGEVIPQTDGQILDIIV